MEKIKVLDHGYVALVEAWGSDERVVEAARMSTDKGFKGWGYYHWKCPTCVYSASTTGSDGEVAATCPNCKSLCVLKESYPGDEKLLRYLRANHHDSPFEFAGMVVEVQAPIFVFREWHRHRTQSYNEMSARYTPLPDVNYVPSVERLTMNVASNNRQAQSLGNRADAFDPETVRRMVASSYQDAEKLYQVMLEGGVPKELARLVIPVGRYSRMRAAACLRNWLHFLTLRMDEHAQWEIRQYANVVGGLIAERFPRTWALFAETRQK